MIIVNGKKEEIEEINLLEYLKIKEYKTDRIAVELNGNIVKRDQYEEIVIISGDKVEIVCFVGGG